MIFSHSGEEIHLSIFDIFRNISSVLYFSPILIIADTKGSNATGLNNKLPQFSLFLYRAAGDADLSLRYSDSSGK